MTPEEFAQIQAAFDSPKYGREYPLILWDITYQCVRVDSRAIYAKSVCEKNNCFSLSVLVKL